MQNHVFSNINTIKSNHIANLQINYYSDKEASIIDNIPDINNDNLIMLSFPFLLSAKMLFNYPPPAGDLVLQKALKRIKEKIDASESDRADYSLLGIFCDTPITIIGGRLGNNIFGRVDEGKWIYKASMYKSENRLGMETEIANGNEEHFHAATIDLVYEWIRGVSWKLNSLICSAQREYLQTIEKNGINNLVINYQAALDQAHELGKLLRSILEE